MIKNNEEFVKKVQELTDDYVFLEEYKSSREKLDCYHKTCGNIFKVCPNNFISGGRRCPKCSYEKSASLKKKTNEEFLKEVNLDEFEVLDKYNGAHIKIKFRHKRCGKITEATPAAFVRSKCGCKYCYREEIAKSKSKTNEMFSSQVKEFDDYVFLEDYKNAKTHIKCLHKRCGRTFNVSPSAFIFDHTRCPYCSDYVSSQEKEIREYIESKGYNVEKLNRSKENTFEIDVYIPELKMGFEFNGAYWHCSKHKRIYRKYHATKIDYQLRHGIKVYSLWDYWGLDKCKNIIDAKLGEGIRIPARKCKLVALGTKDAKEFTDRYHIHGYAKAKKNYGLVYNNKLVSVLGIRITREYAEVSRYVTIPGVRIIGGFSKIIYQVKKDFKGKDLLSYLYKDLCPDYHDSVYYKSGWNFKGDSGPIMSYYVCGKNIVEPRQKYQKYKLKNLFPDSYSSNETELEILEKEHIYAIWDSGNYKFELKNK